MAIACLRLLTFLPLPDLSVPFLRRRIALSTRFEAAGPYFRLPDDFLAAIPDLSFAELLASRDAWRTLCRRINGYIGSPYSFT